MVVCWAKHGQHAWKSTPWTSGSNILDQKKVDRGKSFLHRILARMAKIHSPAEAFSNAEIEDIDIDIEIYIYIHTHTYIHT